MDVIETLIYGGIANHYNSDGIGSLHVTPHSKTIRLKNLEV
jgi:hypothetical protein